MTGGGSQSSLSVSKLKPNAEALFAPGLKNFADIADKAVWNRAPVTFLRWYAVCSSHLQSLGYVLTFELTRYSPSWGPLPKPWQNGNTNCKVCMPAVNGYFPNLFLKKREEMSRDYWRKWWISLSSQLRLTGWRARFTWGASLRSLVARQLHLLVNGCPTRNQGCLDFDSASSSCGDTVTRPYKETRPRSNVADWIVHYIQFSCTVKIVFYKQAGHLAVGVLSVSRHTFFRDTQLPFQHGIPSPKPLLHRYGTFTNGVKHISWCLVCKGRGEMARAY